MTQKKRLAEMLVEEGLITELQLQNALQRQLIMGGKVGTNLIELKYVSEGQLGDILSKIYKIPYVSAHSFSNIPPDVINSIPREIAVRHRIIPIKKEHKNITIALENPNNLSVIDELRFITGCRLTPVVASEIRIALELERYYDQPRDIRYLKIQRPSEEFIIERDSPSVQKEKTRKSEEMIVTGNSEGWLSGPDEQDYYTPATVSIPPIPGARSFQDTVSLLSKTETRDDAINTVLDYISQYVENVIFFVTSVSDAKVWSKRCKGIEEKTISDLKISFGGPSVFLTVKQSEEPYYGEISLFPFDKDFLENIGYKKPIKVLLVPVIVKTKMVAILYVDNSGKGIEPERIAEINSIIEKLSLVFEILILKKKTESLK